MNNITFIEVIYAVWIFIVGLCIGSFLNVVVLRGLSGESIVLPPSKCPVCHNKLKWWMNIPLLSYLLLRGKCGFCKTKISVQYPIVEAFTGIIFTLIFCKFLYSIETIFYIIGASLIIAMSVTDIKESVIFDTHAYILVGVGLLYSLLTGNIVSAIIGGIIGFLIYEILARSGYLFVGERAFGEGDSLIAAGIGAFFGWKMMLVSTVTSVLVMSVFVLPYFFIRSYKQGKKRTVNALLSAVLFIILAFIITKYDLIKNYMGIIIFLSCSIIWTIWFIKQILSDVKLNRENNESEDNKSEENENEKSESEETAFCALPYGPAMGASFFIIMFFSNELTNLIKAYFG